MKCRDAQDILYLYRPGELTGERRKALEEHLISCPTCAAESKAALEMEKRVSEVRSIEPRLEDPPGLTRAIMAAVSSQRPLNVPSNLAGWTMAPAFRIAACVALFLLCGTFFLQTAMDARDIATLEGRLKVVRTTAHAIDSQDIQRAGLLLSGTNRIAGPPDGVTHVRQWQNEPAMSAVLQTLLGRQGKNETTMIDYLAKRHPRLASIRIDDGFDDHEREILASDGEAFLKDVEALLQKGGVHHDR